MSVPPKSKASKGKSPDASQDSPIQFEQSLAELEQLVQQLEAGDLSLEDALQQFERGVQLTKQCQQALSAAEQKVQVLLGGEAGELTDFSGHSADEPH